MRLFRRLAVVLLNAVTAVAAYGLTIPAGTLYFDNTKTNYTQVQFVFGNDNGGGTYVRNMVFDGQKWSVQIDAAVNNMYRFTFSDTRIPEGHLSSGFTTVKDSISNRIGANRTATSDASITAGWIFVPQSSDNWAQGSWQSLSAWQNVGGGSGGGSSSANVSGTLPVVYLNTLNGQTIASKETYVQATCYIDSMGQAQYRSLGSKSSPVSLQVRGRGNWTWNGFDKKPYKLLLDSKTKVLGMKKSKHWALMAGADDDLGFLRNHAGCMVSELLGMRWTPAYVPVELVLNGKYQGLYFLTETVRVEGGRVEVTEQRDGCTDTDSVSGGWLVEIDNYSEEGQVCFTEGNGQNVRVTLHSPEILSAEQRNYITANLNEVNSALYESSSAHWEQLIDLDEIAKYYLVQEILEDCESFHGSCYFYKDKGVGQKWYFGPVWDFGNSFRRRNELFIYDRPSFEQYWIGQIASFPAFQRRVKEFWYDFLHTGYDSLLSQIDAFAVQVSAAAANDAVCWKSSRNVCRNADMAERSATFASYITWRVNWLRSQWGEGIAPVVEPEAVEKVCKRIENGQLLIYRGGKRYSSTGVLLGTVE